MAKVICKESKILYVDGMTIEVLKGAEYSTDSSVFKKCPEIFEGTKEVKRAEPKEELLVEEPVAEAEVEVKEEPKEEAPKRRKRK